jgi:uncharacterized lipoprotein YmbA
MSDFQVVEAEDKEGDFQRSIEMQERILVNLKEQKERAKQNSIAAENNYKKSLDKLNATIDRLNGEFKQNLNSLMDNHIDQVEVLKMKF